ncbi:MAG TPA: phytanoyl-CoA dioxygenase family protein [Fimbriimonadaceae bacterium]|nr:phytanoyl-CoA dioxygenase family protein [Fimbriimonadaceae bacterium]
MGTQLEVEGWRLEQSVFATDEIARLIELLPWLGSTAGTRNLLEFQWCRDLAADPRIVALVGAGAKPIRAILFDKNPGANWTLGWHQDTKIAVKRRADVPGFESWSEKEGVVHCRPPVSILESCVAARIHLDPCGSDNGALMVVPGSHLHGFIGEVFETDAARECTADLGDVILMKPLLLHASSKAKSPSHRRVIHIEYCSASLPDGLEWAYA